MPHPAVFCELCELTCCSSIHATHIIWVMWFEVYDTSRIISHCGCTTYLSIYNFNGHAVYAHTATQCGSTVLFTLILTLASNVHSIDTELTPWPMLKHIMI